MKGKYLFFSSIVRNFKESVKKIIFLICIFVFVGTLVGLLVNSQPSVKEDSGAEKVENDKNQVYVLKQDEYEVYGQEIVEQMYQHKDYYDNSILMHLNPYDTNAEVAYVKINTKDVSDELIETKIADLFAMYRAFFSSNECYEFICEKTGINYEKKYLDELWSIGKVDKSTILVFQINGSDSELVKSMMDALIEYIKQKEQYVQESICKHELDFFLRESKVICNPSLDSQQRSQRMLGAYYYGSGGAESIQNTFRLITDFGSKSITENTSDKSANSYSFLYGIFGGIIGIIVVIIYILSRCYKDDRIYDYSEYCKEKNLKYIDLYRLSSTGHCDESVPMYVDINNILKNYSGKVCIAFSQEILLDNECINILEKYNTCIVDGYYPDVNKLETIIESDNIVVFCKKNKTTFGELNYIFDHVNISDLTKYQLVIL